MTSDEEMKAQEFLKKYASAKQYFKPPVDKEIKVKFLKADSVKSHFDGGKSEIPRYYLEVDGQIQYWDRPSKRLAAQMSAIPFGSFISIFRSGYKNETKYEIKKVE